jgi:anti-sigma B factor antagonist
MNIDRQDAAEGVAVLKLDGRLNMVAAPRLKEAVDQVVEGGRSHVVVDMADVTFMDSSGLGALIAGLKKARQGNGDLRISGINDQVATVLRLTNLDRVLRAHPSVEAATDGW